MKKNKNKHRRHRKPPTNRTTATHDDDIDIVKADTVDDETMLSSAIPSYTYYCRVVTVLVLCFLMAVLTSAVVVIGSSSSSSSSASSSLSSASVSPASASSASAAIDSTDEQEQPAKETTLATGATLLVKEEGWSIIQTYPHDPSSFTQGLEIVMAETAGTAVEEEPPGRATVCTTGTQDYESSTGGSTCTAEVTSSDGQDQEKEEENEGPHHLIVESTGMHGDSILRIWNPRTGAIVKETKLASKYFGEGVCRYINSSNDERALYVQLTWQEQTLVIYDARTLEVVKTLETWPSPTTTREGWGITWNPLEEVFYVSDGSHYLHVWDIHFQQIAKIPVYMEELRDGQGQVYVAKKTTVDEDGRTTTTQQPISRLNELEYDGTTQTILANVLMEDVVLRIEPTTGWVSHIYDFSTLYPRDHRNPHDDVFNGIAIVPHTAGQEWYVTGKYWSTLYHLRLHHGE